MANEGEGTTENTSSAGVGEVKSGEGTTSTEVNTGTVDTTNKGDYEALPVDEGQQSEIDAILGKPSKEGGGLIDEDKLLEHFEGGKKDAKESKEKEGSKEAGGKEQKEEKVTDVKKEENEGDEDPVIVAMRAEILSMSAKIAELEGGVKNAPVKKEEENKEDKEDKDKGKKEEAKQQPLPPITLESLGIDVDDATYDKMFEDKDTFKKILGDVAMKTAEVTAKRIYMGLPKIIDTMVYEKVGLNVRATKMYNEHPELKAHAAFVGQTANQLAKEHPDWNADKIFTELPGHVKTLLGIKTTAKRKDEIAVRTRPGFAGRGSGVRPITPENKGGGEQKTGMASEIEDMINTN
jgi:hypothetical protein